MILSLLQEEDMYGYQLVGAIEERSGGKITIQIGSLYPVLYRLRDEGCISENQVPIGRRKFRVYYHVEPHGLDVYQELLQEHYEFQRALDKILSAPANRKEGGNRDE